jgi:hypothetical protein
MDSDIEDSVFDNDLENDSDAFSPEPVGIAARRWIQIVSFSKGQ